eukprot:gene12595-12726_t
MSQRQRHRPMEFWRNEKAEYERSHKSLPTIRSYVSVTPDPAWPAPAPEKNSKSRTKQQQQQQQDHNDEQHNREKQQQSNAQQACINLWVDEMRFKQYGHLPGVACASRGPNNVQDCVIQWVIEQQQTETGGALGGCAGTNKADGSQLACVNRWVLDHQAKGWTPGTDKPKTCKSYAPEKAKSACYDAWVFKHQELHSLGPFCAKGKTVKKVQLCILDYVAKQQRRQGGTKDCKKAANKYACVRAWIEQQMMAGGP